MSTKICTFCYDSDEIAASSDDIAICYDCQGEAEVTNE